MKMTIGCLEYTLPELEDQLEYHGWMLADCIEFDRGFPDFHRLEIQYFLNLRRLYHEKYGK